MEKGEVGIQKDGNGRFSRCLWWILLKHPLYAKLGKVFRMAQLHSLLSNATATSPLVFVGSFLGLFFVYYLFAYLRDPLRSVPGPFWARFTRLWYLKQVAGGHFEKTNVELHRRHGIHTGLSLRETLASC